MGFSDGQSEWGKRIGEVRDRISAEIRIRITRRAWFISMRESAVDSLAACAIEIELARSRRRQGSKGWRIIEDSVSDGPASSLLFPRDSKLVGATGSVQRGECRAGAIAVDIIHLRQAKAIGPCVEAHVQHGAVLLKQCEQLRTAGARGDALDQQSDRLLGFVLRWSFAQRLGALGHPILAPRLLAGGMIDVREFA